MTFIQDSQNDEVSTLSVPERKRTMRACDQCRRRKTKCNGKHCCKTCAVIGLQCSYGSTIKQARGPRYVAHLEQRIEHLENKARKRGDSVTPKPEWAFEDPPQSSSESPPSVPESPHLLANPSTSLVSSDPYPSRASTSSQGSQPSQPSSFAEVLESQNLDDFHLSALPTLPLLPNEDLTSSAPLMQPEFDNFTFDQFMSNNLIDSKSFTSLWPNYDSPGYAMLDYAPKHWGQ